VRGSTDGGIAVGWFKSDGSPGSCGAPGGSLPEQILGFATGGQSSLGERIWPTFHFHGTKTGRPGLAAAPLLRFDANWHTWELRYTPTFDADGVARSGQITFTYQGQAISLTVSAANFDPAAEFDRFGIRTIDCSGMYEEIYLDDLTYTATPATAPPW